MLFILSIYISFLQNIIFERCIFLHFTFIFAAQWNLLLCLKKMLRECIFLCLCAEFSRKYNGNPVFEVKVKKFSFRNTFSFGGWWQPQLVFISTRVYFLRSLKLLWRWNFVSLDLKESMKFSFSIILLVYSRKYSLMSHIKIISFPSPSTLNCLLKWILQDY